MLLADLLHSSKNILPVQGRLNVVVEAVHGLVVERLATTWFDSNSSQDLYLGSLVNVLFLVSSKGCLFEEQAKPLFSYLNAYGL